LLPSNESWIETRSGLRVEEFDDGGNRLSRLLFHEPVAGIGDDNALDIGRDEAQVVGLFRAE